MGKGTRGFLYPFPFDRLVRFVLASLGFVSVSNGFFSLYPFPFSPSFPFFYSTTQVSRLLLNFSSLPGPDLAIAKSI